jgi:HEAT repeat protein
VYELQIRQGIDFGGEPTIQDFIRPEAERLLEDFQNSETKDHRRLVILDTWKAIGDTALPAIMGAFKYSSAFSRFALGHKEAFNAIFKAFPLSLNSLVEFFTHVDPDVRAAAVEAVGQLGDASVVAPLIERLADNSETVRGAAAMALGQLRDPSAIAPLIERITNDRIYARVAAAMAIKQLGVPSAVADLIEHLADEEWMGRHTAVVALGIAGNPLAIPPLIERLEDEFYFIRHKAAIALAQLGNASGEHILIQMLTGGERFLVAKDNVADALRKIGTPEALAAVEAWEKNQKSD